ncbi:MAG TPA: pilus assembly PilX N-terminal domain-containing protein [Vicinamibacterales bacterium]|nr:pilus assembly PilX N-terminal domain-containing protein [Vicinamibacterales bacterium]
MRIREEKGIALLVALMAVMLMGALGAALVMTTSSETIIASNYSRGNEGLYAADAAFERAMDDILTVPDWNNLLNGSTQSAFIDGPPSGTRTLPDGSTIDVAQAINMANCGKVSTCSAADLTGNSTGTRPWGANNPVWQPYAYGPLQNMLPTGTINSSFYVIVMVADDPSETDNDPLHDGTADTNPGRGVIAMRAEAFGPRGAHKVIEMTLARTDTTNLERGYTGQRGEDEQNRRARKAAVQTPGKSLTMQSMALNSGGIQ